jgi:hypothetical protein
MAKKFFSICSAHQVKDENCPLCKDGVWVEDKDIITVKNGVAQIDFNNPRHVEVYEKWIKD